MRTYALLLGLSLLSSVLLTPLVQRLAHRFGWLDQPGDRKIHRAATPRLGGVAVFLAFLVALVPLFWIDNRITTALKIQWPIIEPLPIAIGIIFLLGLTDDLFGVSPYVKLLVEVGCGLWLFFNGLFIELIKTPLGNASALGIWSLPLTVLWIVGITNSFNLVDGMDGLAAGIALFSTAVMIVVSFINGNVVMIVPLMALAGGIGGFLLFNFYPASIFLGDSGSLFLGFTLAALSLVWMQKSFLAVALVGPILLFALPIVDTGLAIVRRFVSGEPLLRGDQDHIHHRLLRRGWSPRKVVLILYAVCFLFGVFALVVMNVVAGIAAFFFLYLLCLSAWLILSRMGYNELAEVNVSLRRELLNRREILSQRVQLAKAATLIGDAKDAQEFWTCIVELARKFDFDSVELFLHWQWQLPSSDDPPALPGNEHVRYHWSSGIAAGASNAREKCWRIEIPLDSDSGGVGRAVFHRALDKRELHFRMEPFVQTVSSAISKGIARVKNGEQAPAVARD